MPRVSWPTQLSQFNLPLPPLPEQQRIAAYLDASCAAIDVAVAIPSVQQSNLNSTRYGRLHIPLPSVTEQRAICELLNTKVGEMKRVVTIIETQIATLTAYRNSLIHECVTGQRRITEAEVRTIQERAAKLTKEPALPRPTA